MKSPAGHLRRNTRFNLTDFFNYGTLKDKQRRVSKEVERAHGRINQRCQSLTEAYAMTSHQREWLLQCEYISDHLGREYNQRCNGMTNNTVRISNDSDGMADLLTEATGQPLKPLPHDGQCFRTTPAAAFNALRFQAADGLSPIFVQEFKYLLHNAKEAIRSELLRRFGQTQGSKMAAPLVTTFPRYHYFRLFQPAKYSYCKNPMVGPRPETLRDHAYDPDWRRLAHMVAARIQQIKYAAVHPIDLRLPSWRRRWHAMDRDRKARLFLRQERRHRPRHNNSPAGGQDALGAHRMDRFPQPPSPRSFSRRSLPSSSSLDPLPLRPRSSASSLFDSVSERPGKTTASQRRVYRSKEARLGDAAGIKGVSSGCGRWQDACDLQGDTSTGSFTEDSYTEHSDTSASQNTDNSALARIENLFGRNGALKARFTSPDDSSEGFPDQDARLDEQLYRVLDFIRDNPESLQSSILDVFFPEKAKMHEYWSGRQGKKHQAKPDKHRNAGERGTGVEDIDFCLLPTSRERLPSVSFTGLGDSSSLASQALSIEESDASLPFDASLTSQSGIVSDSTVANTTGSPHTETPHGDVEDRSTGDYIGSENSRSDPSSAQTSLSTPTSSTEEPKQSVYSAVDVLQASSAQGSQTHPATNSSQSNSNEHTWAGTRSAGPYLSGSVNGMEIDEAERLSATDIVQVDPLAAGLSGQALRSSHGHHDVNPVFFDVSNAASINSNVNRHVADDVSDDEESDVSDSDIVSLVRTANEAAPLDLTLSPRNSMETVTSCEERSKATLQDNVKCIVGYICENIKTLVVERLRVKPSARPAQKKESKPQSQLSSQGKQTSSTASHAEKGSATKDTPAGDPAADASALTKKKEQPPTPTSTSSIKTTKTPSKVKSTKSSAKCSEASKSEGTSLSVKATSLSALEKACSKPMLREAVSDSKGPAASADDKTSSSKQPQLPCSTVSGDCLAKKPRRKSSKRRPPSSAVTKPRSAPERRPSRRHSKSKASSVPRVRAAQPTTTPTITTSTTPYSSRRSSVSAVSSPSGASSPQVLLKSSSPPRPATAVSGKARKPRKQTRDEIVAASSNLLLDAISMAVGDAMEDVLKNSHHVTSSARDLLTAATHVTEDPSLIASLLALITSFLATRATSTKAKVTTPGGGVGCGGGSGSNEAGRSSARVGGVGRDHPIIKHQPLTLTPAMQKVLVAMHQKKV